MRKRKGLSLRLKENLEILGLFISDLKKRYFTERTYNKNFEFYLKCVMEAEISYLERFKYMPPSEREKDQHYRYIAKKYSSPQEPFEFDRLTWKNQQKYFWTKLYIEAALKGEEPSWFR